ERIGWHPGLSGPFTLYTTPRPVAYFSHHGAGCFIPDDNGEYRHVINQLDNLALTPLESAMAIEQFAATFDPQDTDNT
ncbi:Scr1 family TA system antitoxin-like transcriptional regulator, partial [Amycolatopsis ultiminotia]|uniref:Scr1 family TA system antitoxin-like transcriptional regulator n=1 Tax=Amycolatopsis ultiminotia TaxID=543629 RepID=UPI0031EA8299